MRGHSHLLYLRRNGRCPVGGVMVDTTARGTTWSGDWSRMGMSMAFVDIKPSDSLHDLRFAIGLEVQVSGDDEKRVGEVAKAFIAAGAARVVAGCGRGAGEEWQLERFAFGNEECMQWPT